MSLRERLGHWIAGGERAATEPIAFHSQTARFFGTGLGNQPAHEDLLRESKGIPGLANRAISARISTLDPLVKTSSRDTSGTLTDETLDDHPLKMLLDRPHPNFTRSQLLRLTSQHVIDVGEAYWLKVGSRLGIPVQLHPIPPGAVKPILSTGVVEAYDVRDGDGTTRTLPADTIVRFFFPDPEDPWASEGYLGPAAVTADALKFGSQHLRSHYQHDATPKTTLEAGEGAVGFTPEEKERFDAEWKRTYHQRVGDSMGVPAITPTGYKLVQLALQSGADVTPLLEFWRDDLLMNHGVPRSVLGQVVSGDRSSAETNQFVFDLHTVSPIAALIADALTLQLAPDFDPGIFVEFDEFVSADKAFDLARETADLTQKVRSVNHVREDRGLDPVEWGDDPVGTIGDSPYDPNAPDFLPDDDPDAMEDGDPTETPSQDEQEDEPDEERTGATGGPSVRSSRALYFTPRAAWKRQIAQEKKYVPVLSKRFRSIFRRQADSVITRLVEALAGQRMRADDIDRVFNPADWERAFKLEVNPMLTEAFRESAQITMEGLTGGEFIFGEKQARLMDQFGATLVTNVNNTTRLRLARTLAEAVELGESIDQMAKRIESVMVGKAGRSRARTIARTEVLKTAQSAQLESFDQSGVVARKRWHTSLDANVRDTHAATEGQTVKMGELFTLGDGEQADAPGIGANGSSLRAANSINCRCFVLPVTEG